MRPLRAVQLRSQQKERPQPPRTELSSSLPPEGNKCSITRGRLVELGKKRGIESRTPAHHSVLCSLGILSTQAGLRITTKQYTPPDEPGCNTTARQDRMILEIGRAHV